MAAAGAAPDSTAAAAPVDTGAAAAAGTAGIDTLSAFPAAASPRAPAPEAITLAPKVVLSRRKSQASTVLKSEFIRKLPGTMNDPVRAMATTPGVTVQNDVNVRPFVRGGDAGQTRVVLDGMPLLQPYHVGGSFSLFNLNTLESVELFRDDFKVEDPGALSGVLRLKTPGGFPERTRVRSSVSMLRGDLYAETPIVANRLSVYGSAQSFLFNRSLHGILDLTSAMSGDSAFQAEMQGYRDHINMPDFTDYHWGFSAAPADNLRIDYLGGVSGDDFAVIVPKQTNILGKINPNFGDPTAPVAPNYAGKPEKPRAKKLSLDSLSTVNINNQMHFLALAWDVNSRHAVENDFGWQSQKWNVGFKDNTGSLNPVALDQDARYYNWRLSDAFTPSENHRITFGASYDYKRQAYWVNLPYVLYDVIVNSNMDMLQPLEYFSDGGFTIAKEDSSAGNFDYLGEYPSRIHFTHRGVLEEQFGSLFFSHAWKSSRGTLSYGLRGEYQSTSREFFPAPRMAYRWEADAKNDLLFTAGLYSQNNLPFYERDRNPTLRSEKSGQAGVQWTRRIARGWKVVADGYYKRYYDLVTPSLEPDNTIDLKGFLLPRPDSPLAPEEIAALRNILDTVKDFTALPEPVKRLSYETFGGLGMRYSNSGTGNSLGTELSLYYEPSPRWSGWLSADFSLSDRRDGPDRASYPYRYHRPVVLNWANYFDIPGGFDISLTYRWALGQPYTPYSGVMAGVGSTEPITVGARNSGRLSPYSRLDMRLTRNAQLWHRDFKAYMEIWNSMNNPNYFARDSRTGELKSAQLNWPFPLFFLGVSADI